MKKIVILVGVVVLAGCTVNELKRGKNETIGLQQQNITIYKNTESGINSIITNQALESIGTDYAKASKNKAFAQSPSGAWNWKSNRTSVEHAKTSALIGCQRNNKKSEDLYPCKIINVNDEWVK